MVKRGVKAMVKPLEPWHTPRQWPHRKCIATVFFTLRATTTKNAINISIL